MWSNERENSVMKNAKLIRVRCRLTNEMLATMPGKKDTYEDYIASKAPDALTKEQEIEASGIEKVSRDGMTIFPRGLFYFADDGRYFDPKFGTMPDVTKIPGQFKIVPFMWDYQWRGSFKESIGMIQRAGGKAKKATKTKASTVMPESSEEALNEAEQMLAAAAPANGFACSKITAYKKVVDGNWHVKEKRIPLYIPDTYIDDFGNVQSSYDETVELVLSDELADEYGSIHGLKTCVRALRADTMQGPRIALAKSEVVPIGTECHFTVSLMNPNDEDAFIECMDLKEYVGMLQWRGGAKGTLIWTRCDEYGVPID